MIIKRSYYLFLLISSVFLQGCHPENTQNDHQLSVFRYNESKGITSLDPVYAKNQTLIWPVSQLFNGLVQLDDSLRVVPAIARTWSISEDGRIYQFHLRNDVFFHPSGIFRDGTRNVTASDFVFSFMRVLDPKIGSPGNWIFEHLDKDRMFEAKDDSTLILYLDRSFPPFLSMLAMPYCYVVPREAFSNTTYDFAHQPVGTGPFLFKHWSTDEKLILRKNPTYFETGEDGEQLPYLDAIAISFIKDKQSEFLEFLNGNLDFLSGVHPAYKDELLTRSGMLNPKYSDTYQLITQPYLNTEYLGFQLEGDSEKNGNILLNKKVRQAINYGFNRSKMMKYMRNNLGYPANGGMIPRGLPGHLADSAGYYYDPDRASKLLVEAGYPAGEGIENIVLTTTSDYLDLCEFIQYELQGIGLTVEINVSTGAAFRNMVANGNLPFFRGSWIADYADAENYLALFYSPNFSPAGPNYTRFSSPEYDRLYESAILSANDEERYRLYRSMDSLVISEAPVVPLYYDMVVRFVPGSILGFTPNPMNNLVLKNVRKTEVR